MTLNVGDTVKILPNYSEHFISAEYRKQLSTQTATITETNGRFIKVELANGYQADGFPWLLFENEMEKVV